MRPYDEISAGPCYLGGLSGLPVVYGLLILRAPVYADDDQRPILLSLPDTT